MTEKIVRKGNDIHLNPLEHDFSIEILPIDERKYGLNGFKALDDYYAIFRFYRMCKCEAISCEEQMGFI